MPLHRRAAGRACRRGLPCRCTCRSGTPPTLATCAMDTTSALGLDESHNRDGSRSSARGPANRVCGARRSRRGCRRALRYRSAGARAAKRSAASSAVVNRSGTRPAQTAGAWLSAETIRHPLSRRSFQQRHETHLAEQLLVQLVAAPRQAQQLLACPPGRPARSAGRRARAAGTALPGIASGAAAIRMPSYGPCAGQP